MKSSALKRAYCRLTAGAGAFYQHIYLAQTHIHAAASGLLRGSLRGERRPFTGSLETHRAGAGGGDHVALRVRNADDGVVEGGIDVRFPLWDSAPVSPASAGPGHLLLPSGAASPAGDCPTRSLASAGVGPGSLAVYG